MYLEHYGFKVEPFELAPKAEFLYLSKGHKKALTYLNYALWNKDTFTLLTGEIGSGKTILLQHLLRTMPSTAQIVTIYQTQLSPHELLSLIARQLDLVGDEDLGKPSLYKLINSYLENLKKNLVIIVDEAQRFSFETLEELRLLAGADLVSTSNNVNVILCGQPELKNIVESGNLAQLNQRIKLRFHLTTLDYNETSEYINFRVCKAGQNLEIFTTDAVRKIYDLTNGLPRLINILADTALTCGFADGFYAISSKQVDDAVKELNWGTVSQLTKSTSSKENIVRLNPQNIDSQNLSADVNLGQSLSRIEASLSRIADAFEKFVGRNDSDSTSNNHKLG